MHSYLLVLLALVAATYASKRVLFASFPGRSHVVFQLPIAQELQQRNYSVVVVTTENYRKLVESYGLEFIPYEKGAETIMDKIQADRDNLIERDSIISSFPILFKIMAEYYPYSSRVLAKQIEQNLPDIMVLDMFENAGADLAVEHNIPFVEVMCHGIIDEGPKYLPAQFTDYRLEEMNSIYNRFRQAVIMPLQMLWYAVLPSILNDPFKKVREEAKIRDRTPPKLKFREHRAAAISGSFFGFEYTRAIEPDLHMVGIVNENFNRKPDLNPADLQLQQWLDSQSKVVFIALGSIAVIQPWQWKTLVQGAVDSFPDMQVLVGLREGDNNLRNELRNISDRVRVESWVNQRMVLAHNATKVFLTHGGYQSLTESLENSKPMLVFPVFAEQPANSARLTDAGAALRLNKQDFSAEEVSQKLRRLVLEPSFAKNAARLYQLGLSYGGEKKAADVIENILKFGTDHIRKSENKLNYLARNNLDIKLLAGVILIGTYFLIKRLRTSKTVEQLQPKSASISNP